MKDERPEGDEGEGEQGCKGPHVRHRAEEIRIMMKIKIRTNTSERSRS
jgi:hypothetical protein